jgi:nitric oxide reductase subunit B
MKKLWLSFALVFSFSEGDGFYGIKLSQILPYSVTRTWHVQLGIFWIATAWLAAGLFIGPLVSKLEPKWQSVGVHILFGALLLIVAGSMAGEWMSVHHKLSPTASFFWGHQGYEYVDLGRAWQILLFAGLLIWLFLVVRAVRPALHATRPHSTSAGRRRRHYSPQQFSSRVGSSALVTTYISPGRRRLRWHSGPFSVLWKSCR